MNDDVQKNGIARVVADMELEIDKAAKAIHEADFILIAAGAGFSADSGLPVYADIARVEKYASRGITYAELADVSLLVSEPELFLEFWQSCVKIYKDKVPHVGYEILNKWCEKLCDRKLNISDPVNPFYVYTSNVDGYFRHFPVLKTHLCEMHGCVQEFVCSSSIGFIHQSSPTSQMDYEPRSTSFWQEWNIKTTAQKRRQCMQMEAVPSEISIDLNSESQVVACCTNCKLPLRPKVIMFGDTCPNTLERVAMDTDRYQAWENGMEEFLMHEKFGNLVIVELGCGTRVPSVRNEVEEVLHDVANISKIINHSSPVLIRINSSAEDAALSSGILKIAPESVSIRGNCKDSLVLIDEKVSSLKA